MRGLYYREKWRKWRRIARQRNGSFLTQLWEYSLRAGQEASLHLIWDQKSSELGSVEPLKKARCPFYLNNGSPCSFVLNTFPKQCILVCSYVDIPESKSFLLTFLRQMQHPFCPFIGNTDGYLGHCIQKQREFHTPWGHSLWDTLSLPWLEPE